MTEKGDLYKPFYTQLKLKYNLTKEDIKEYTHVGWFHADQAKCNISINVDDEADRGKRMWEYYMGKIPMPYELVEDTCVCNVPILWNHILIADLKADELEILILGSECIERFGCIKAQQKCSKCKINPIQNRDPKNSTGKCNECNKVRWCEREGCSTALEKYKRYTDGLFCSDKCKNPNNYCECGAKKWGDRPVCYQCYKKKNPDKCVPIPKRRFYCICGEPCKIFKGKPMPKCFDCYNKIRSSNSH
jgi:hypothetical protein